MIDIATIYILLPTFIIFLAYGYVMLAFEMERKWKANADNEIKGR